MKRSLALLASSAVIALAIGGSAFAADLAYKPAEPVAVVVPAFNWTGFYVGAHAGYEQISGKTTDTNGGVAPGPFSSDGGSARVGGQIGYNYQFDVPVVVGLEADAGYSWAKATGTIPSSTSPYHQNILIDHGFYGDITARLGYSFDLGNGSAILPYLKGGYAYRQGDTSQCTLKPGYTCSSGGARSGWTAGGGVEYAIDSHWSVKLEGMYTDLGTKKHHQTSVTDDPVGYVYNAKTKAHDWSVIAGINYRF